MANDLDKSTRPKKRDPAFAAAMTMLRGAFPPAFGVNTDEQFATYWWALQDLDAADVLAAAQEIVRRDDKMPVPSAIRDEVTQLRIARATKKSISGGPTRIATYQQLKAAVKRVVDATIDANLEHVERLITKAAERGMNRAETLWRIRLPLHRAATEAVLPAIFGNGTMPNQLSFEVYNQRILEDLASWGRLSTSGLTRHMPITKSPISPPTEA